MPRTTLALTSFVSGELGAKLDGRTDFNKYATGAKTLENFLPTAGVFAVAAFKILPSGNRLLLAFQSMRFHYQGLKILKNELK